MRGEVKRRRQAAYRKGFEDGAASVAITDQPSPGNQTITGETVRGERCELPPTNSWSGWDQSNLPWSRSKHQDAVCAAVFGPTWSMGEAHAVIAAIDSALASPAPSTHVTGIELSARFVETRLKDYIDEFGSTDPETGTVELPGNGAEYVGELEEIIEGIRALSHPSADQPNHSEETEQREPKDESQEIVCLTSSEGTTADKRQHSDHYDKGSKQFQVLQGIPQDGNLNSAAVANLLPTNSEVIDD